MGKKTPLELPKMEIEPDILLNLEMGREAWQRRDWTLTTTIMDMTINPALDELQAWLKESNEPI